MSFRPSGLFIKAVRAVLTAALTTVTPFEVVLLCENYITLVTIVEITLLKLSGSPVIFMIVGHVTFRGSNMHLWPFKQEMREMVHFSGIYNPYKTTSLRGYPNIFIRRLDLLPDDQNGNKGFKLKYNLEKALAMSDPHILTFGGYYSNHLHAAAAACSKAQIRLTAVIRGEEPKTYGKTLRFLVDHGARLHFVSRKVYSEKYSQPFLDEIRRLYGKYHLIPEGGANKEGVRGCMEILQEEDEKYTHICCACGTGTMAAGLLMTLKTHQHLIVVSSLAGGNFQKDEIERLCIEAGMTSEAVQQKIGQLTLITNYHFGGYAKWDEELITFIKTFHERELIPLEQVYTGKMLFGLTKSLSEKSEIFPSGSNVLAIHSGGLQGAIPELTFS